MDTMLFRAGRHSPSASHGIKDHRLGSILVEKRQINTFSQLLCTTNTGSDSTLPKTSLTASQGHSPGHPTCQAHGSEMPDGQHHPGLKALQTSKSFATPIWSFWPPNPHLSASPLFVRPEMTMGSKGSSVPEMVIPKGPPYRFSSTV